MDLGTPATADVAASSSPLKTIGKANSQLDHAIARTRDWLLDEQHPDGYWCAELEGDTILESEYILLLAWLGQHESDAARRAAECIRQKQMPEGGWNQYPHGPLEISGSVKAYFALKLTGHDPDAEYMRRARGAIRDHGGADRVNSFTRFYLALLGQISYDHCPAVPPEMVLLPKGLPINLYRISSWSRTIFVPLSIVWAHRPLCELPKELGIDELFINPPDRWPALSCPGAKPVSGLITWEKTFRALDRMLKFCERWKMRPLRKRALRIAQAWILERFDDSDGLGAIFPPIVWSVIALKCLGYDDDSPEVLACLEELEKLAIDEGETRRLQPCQSPVWDTTITLRALAAAGCRTECHSVRDRLPIRPTVTRGIEWLLSKEVRTPGDWSQTVDAEPGGWFFEHRNRYYPDVDDTAMGLLALHDQLGIEFRDDVLIADFQTGAARGLATEMTQRALDATQRAVNWMLAMQNRDGGWGAFDRDNDAEFLCKVPFADHNAMIDPSTPDLSARVLEALGHLRLCPGHPAIKRCIQYLRETQEEDGSWYGRWGVNYIYGTWQVLAGLAACGFAKNDPMMRRGSLWLKDHQQRSGGWGESADSYEDPSLRGKGPATASQTAWAMLGLIAAGEVKSDAVKRGAQWLMETQNRDGTWDETEFTGTGFPRVFYLKYHYYRIYFPLLALAAVKSQSTNDKFQTNHKAQLPNDETSPADEALRFGY